MTTTMPNSSPIHNDSAAVANDMVQCHLLQKLFSQSLKGKLALKGGMAMRVGAGSARYTKDIDLAADSRVPKEFVQRAIKLAIRDLSATHLVEDVVVSTPKQTDTTLRWKINGRVGASDIHLTVEVSRRDRLPENHVVAAKFIAPPSYNIPPVVCECFDATALAATKVGCLTSRTREAPRDIYDLFVLIKMQVYPPLEYLQRMPRAAVVDAVSNLWTTIQKMDFKTAETALTPFLSAVDASRFDAASWDGMRLAVGEHVEGWLTEALGSPVLSVSALRACDPSEAGLCPPSM
jgi:predicted nucleotidyltransferase component of viral defense system